MCIQARKKLTKLLQGLVDLKRRRNHTKTKTKRDMMDSLLEVTDEDGRKLEDENIMDLLLVFLLAGHESSAHGILWTIIYLTQHSQFFQRAKVLSVCIILLNLCFHSLIFIYCLWGFLLTKLCTFQKEQEEIMQARPSTQKGLNLKEIKQMEYLSKVFILLIISSWWHVISINNSKIMKNGDV